MNLSSLLRKAEHSSSWNSVLNLVLARVVPFNRSHKFRVSLVSPKKVTVVAPYRKSNFNHLGGLHACALATVAEISTGALLSYHLDPKEFRIIMKTMAIQYHHQGRMAASATCEVEESWVQQNILDALSGEEAVLVTLESKVFDTNENHLCSGQFEWQVKRWKSVKTI